MLTYIHACGSNNTLPVQIVEQEEKRKYYSRRSNGALMID